VRAPEHFQPLWKLRFLVEHAHISAVIVGSLPGRGRSSSAVSGP
jgi:hypothetical protein